MSNSVFKDIYNKNLKLNFKNLSGTLEIDYDSKTENKKTKEELKNLSDERIESLFSEVYNNSNIENANKLTEFEKQVVDEQIIRARKKADKITEELQKSKAEILSRVKGKTFTLDISRSQRLRASANNIFGGDKTEITYEDYLKLLEMQKQIIVNESSDILNEG